MLGSPPRAAASVTRPRPPWQLRFTQRLDLPLPCSPALRPPTLFSAFRALIPFLYSLGLPPSFGLHVSVESHGHLSSSV